MQRTTTGWWIVVVGLMVSTVAGAQWVAGSVVAEAPTTETPTSPTPDPEPLWILHRGLGSGTLGDERFGGDGRVVFELWATADASERSEPPTNPDVFQLPHRTATMVIEGVEGPIEITTPTRTFVNNRTRGVGFGRNAGLESFDLFHGPTDDAFETWDMTTPIGPITEVGLPLQWHIEPLIETNRGILAFDTVFVEIDPATFQMWTSEVFVDGFEDGTTDAWILDGPVP